MSDIILKVENLYKRYRLGSVDRTAFKEDVISFFAKLQGKPDPYDSYVTANELASVKNIDEIKSRYVWSLQDINFEVKKGEIVGIIGKNGAGKSTLLKILSKTTTPTRGTIKIKGQIASLLEVGTGFHPELTGRENIYMNGAILGMRRYEIARKLDEIIAFAGVEAYIDTPVKRYSSGMYVRLAFAVAAHLEPDILIVDEVLAVGDAEFQKKCLGKMKDVSSGEGRTVLFVSHNMAAVSALCTQAILLANGKIMLNDSVENVIKQYIFTSFAVQTPSIDFTSRKLERYGNQEYATWKGITLLNGENEMTSIFRMGDKMFIKLTIYVNKVSDDFEIGIGIGNMHDVYLHYLVSTWEGFNTIQNLGMQTITVEIPQVILFPGDYQMIIWIALKGAYYDDAIHEAIKFRVEEGKLNNNETYFERFSKNTQVYTPSKWTLLS